MTTLQQHTAILHLLHAYMRLERILSDKRLLVGASEELRELSATQVHLRAVLHAVVGTTDASFDSVRERLESTGSKPLILP